MYSRLGIPKAPAADVTAYMHDRLRNELFDYLQTVVTPAPLGILGSGTPRDAAHNALGVTNAAIISTALAELVVNSPLQGGGHFWIPNLGDSIPIVGNILVGNPANPGLANCVTIRGTALSTTLSKQDDTDLFVIQPAQAGEAALPGVLIRDLYLKWATPGSYTPSAGAAVHFLNGQRGKIKRCVINEAAFGVVFSNVLDHELEDCQFLNVSQKGGAMISITGPAQDNSQCNQIAISRLNMRGSGGGTSSTVAILITQVEHFNISRLIRITQTMQGVVIAPIAGTNGNDVLHGRLNDFEVGVSNEALVMHATPHDGKIQEIDVTDFYAGNSGQGTFTGHNVDLYDGGNNTHQLDGVRFVNLVSIDAPAAGLRISGGQNLSVSSGMLASNLLCGLLLDGPTAVLRVRGVNFARKYVSDNNIQPLAVQFSGPNVTSDVTIESCDMTGYSLSPPALVNDGGNIQTRLHVRDCPGYNDQKYALTLAGGVGVVVGASLQHYYGPSRLRWTGNPGRVQINGNVLTQPTGSEWLDPYDTVQFPDGLPTNYFWTGY